MHRWDVFLVTCCGCHEASPCQRTTKVGDVSTKSQHHCHITAASKKWIIPSNFSSIILSSVTDRQSRGELVHLPTRIVVTDNDPSECCSVASVTTDHGPDSPKKQGWDIDSNDIAWWILDLGIYHYSSCSDTVQLDLSSTQLCHLLCSI